MRLVVFFLSLSFSLSIRCFGGVHDFREPADLDDYICLNRQYCYVRLYGVHEMEDAANYTLPFANITVERGCVDNSRIADFKSEVNCRQILRMQLTKEDLENGLTCACDKDFCNFSIMPRTSMLFIVLILVYVTNLF